MLNNEALETARRVGFEIYIMGYEVKYKGKTVVMKWDELQEIMKKSYEEGFNTMNNLSELKKRASNE